MDSNKLISLSKKLYPRLKGKTPSTISSLIMSESHYQPIKEVLNGEEILILTFLIKGQTQTNDTDLLYQHIINNLFVFSFLEVTGDEAEDECGRCYGDGKEDCYTCDGDGNENCDECDGTGEDEEGGPCDYCHGGGYVTCGNCHGSGVESCNYCDGSGYVVKESYLPFRQDYYASFDPKLYSILEVIDEEQPINNNLIEMVMDSKYTFLFNEYDGDTDMLPSELKYDDTMFVGVAKGDLRFTKGNNLQDRNLSSY
jgi:hypothetical protein